MYTDDKITTKQTGVANERKRRGKRCKKCFATSIEKGDMRFEPLSSKLFNK